VTASPETGCEQKDRVAEYALRITARGEAAAFEAHLAQCRDCRRELAALGPIFDSLAAWPTDILRPPPALWDRLAKSIGANADGDGADLSDQDAHPSEAETSGAGLPEWKEVAPGISCKVLATDEARDRVSMLVRLAPGVAYPPHTHAGVEELHLLSGELWIDDRKLFPGDFSHAEPGSGDSRVWSETGCTCVLLTSPSDVLR
jgi:anti-sigma factor ChrR (cupin superfamily)